MLYEPRTPTVPGTETEESDRYAKCRELFLTGECIEAKTAAEQFRKEGLQPEQAVDFLLCAEISRACGDYRTYQATIHRAVNRFPDDPRIRIYEARSDSSRGLILRALRNLESRRAELEVALPGSYWSEIGSIYAQCSMEQSARECMDKALAHAEADAVTLYTLSCAASSLREWNEAVNYGRQALALAPGWMRCRSMVLHNLLSRGNPEIEAFPILEEGRALGFEDNSFEFSAAMYSFAMGVGETSRNELLAFLERWPHSDPAPMARRILFVLRSESGDWDGSLQLIEQIEGHEKQSAGEELDRLKQRVRTASENAEAPHRFIRVPVIAQLPSQCVPTAVAMSAFPQGVVFDPNELYQAMQGRDGTMLWRMREWLEEQGLGVACVKGTPDVIKYFIEAGVPLIGVLEGPFNSHVEVVCGYDDRMETLWIRDPSVWFPYTISYEDCEKRWTLHGNTLWAVLSSEHAPRVPIPDDWKAPVGENLQALLKAVIEGDREAAENASSLIPEDSPVAFLRDMTGARVVTTQRQIDELMHRTALDSEADPVLRFRSFLGVDTPESASQIEELVKADDKIFGPFVGRYVALRRRMIEGRWQEALERVDCLLEWNAPIISLWDLRAQILAELGRREEAIQSVDFGLQMAPLSAHFREQRTRLELSRKSYGEILEEAELLFSEEPENHGLRWMCCLALSDGPDGLAYEQRVLDYLRFCPRDTMAQQSLAAWHASQERPDLMRARLSEARALTSEEDIPKWPNEDPDGDAAETDPEENAELPDRKSELLSIAGRLNDPLFPAAIEKLLAFEAESQLAWSESAMIVSQRINRVIADSPGGNAVDEAVNSLLPPEPRGPLPTTVSIVADSVDAFGLPFRSCEQFRAWIERLVPEYQLFPALWFNHILFLEIAGKQEEAFQGYGELVESWPGMDSAWFRMGMIRAGQGLFGDAEAMLNRALAISPGLPGSLQALQNVYDSQNRTDDALAVRERLVKRFPYHLEILSDLVFTIGNHRDWDEARTRLHEASGQQPPAAIQILEARILLREDRPDETPALLEAIAPDEIAVHALDESYLQARLEHALATENQTETLAICEEGLKRWPDSPMLNRVKLDVLAQTDNDRATEEARKQILAGTADLPVLYQYLVMHSAPDRAAISLLEKAGDDRRDPLALQMIEILRTPELHQAALGFLRGTAHTLKHLDEIKEFHAQTLYLDNQHERAIRMAKSLLENDPENPRWLDLIGFCLQDHKPREALEYLRKSFERNESSDTLFRIARCEQLLGNTQSAIKTHREVLERSPHLSGSMTNLWLLNPTEPGLFDHMENAIRSNGGVDDQYFHVAAVKLARKQRRSVPPEWIDGAIQRYQVVLAQGGFGSEKSELRRAICSWLTCWNELEIRRQYGGSLGGLLTRLFWPGHRWVPERPEQH